MVCQLLPRSPRSLTGAGPWAASLVKDRHGHQGRGDGVWEAIWVQVPLLPRLPAAIPQEGPRTPTRRAEVGRQGLRSPDSCRCYHRSFHSRTQSSSE